MTTKPAKLRSSLSTQPWLAWGFAALEFLTVYALAWRGQLWVLVAAVIIAVEMGVGLRGTATAAERKAAFWRVLPGLIMGLSTTLIIAIVPRHASQVAMAVLYGAWLAWRVRQGEKASPRLVHLLLIQAVMFEAIFLMAAIWQLPGWAILVMVWVGAYSSVYGTLVQRGDRSAGVMAATWGVIATEVSWVLLLWLITYTMRGGYVLVPQPALILTALAYVFGSILASSREGKLSRARLGEYLVIGFILVLIVAVDSLLRSTN